MTEAIELDPNKCVCANCGAVGERAEDVFNLGSMPLNWGVLLITRNEGIATNSLVCDLCLLDIRISLASRRDQTHAEATLKEETDDERKARIDALRYPLSSKIDAAKEAGETQIKVTQLGTGAVATVDISEFEGKSYQELVDTSVAETDAAYSEHEAEIDAIKEGHYEEKLTPKPMSNRAKVRAQAAIKKHEQERAESEQNSSDAE